MFDFKPIFDLSEQIPLRPQHFSSKGHIFDVLWPTCSRNLLHQNCDPLPDRPTFRFFFPLPLPISIFFCLSPVFSLECGPGTRGHGPPKLNVLAPWGQHVKPRRLQGPQYHNTTSRCQREKRAKLGADRENSAILFSPPHPLGPFCPPSSHTHMSHPNFCPAQKPSFLPVFGNP